MAYAFFPQKGSFQIRYCQFVALYFSLTYSYGEFHFFLKTIQGSYVFGQKWTYLMNYYTLGVSKIDRLSVLEILRVKTLVHTL